MTALKSTKKTSREYHLLNLYEILVVGETKKVIKKRKSPEDPIKALVTFEDIFSCLLQCHKAVGHKSRDIMLKECQKSYLNLTVHVINSKRSNYRIITHLMLIECVN